MIIVAGALTVDPSHRAAYLEQCDSVLATARATPGCLDFALSPDPLEPGRINVYERWESEEHLRRFRGSGPDDSQLSVLLDIDVAEYRVVSDQAR